MDEQKDLPLPQKDLPLPEKKLPVPDDMLLRAPTFWEKYPFLKFILPTIVVLGIAIPSVLYVLSIQKNQQESSASQNTTISPTITVPTIDSKTLVGKGFPIVNQDTNELLMYSFSENKITKTGITSELHGGSVDHGSSGPQPSPDLLYTAYIDTTTNSIWLMTNTTLEKKQITTRGISSLIGGWSPDSKKIVYFLYEGSFVGGGINGDIVYKKPHLGFFVYDVETEVSKRLPIDSFVRFIDHHRILIVSIKVHPQTYNIFDLNISKLDNNPFQYVHQPSFTSDGKYWTYLMNTTTANTDTSTSQLMYAAFPKTNGAVFAKDSFGMIQWQIISPNGSKIAYEKRIRSNASQKSGSYKNYVWIYDTQTKVSKQIGEGTPNQWIDDNLLIVHSYIGDTYYYVDVRSGKSTSIITIPHVVDPDDDLPYEDVQEERQ